MLPRVPRCVPGCSRAVDLDVDSDLFSSIADGFVDTKEATEVGLEAQHQADFIQGDVSCCGEERKGGRVAAGQALEQVFGGADCGVGTEQAKGFVALQDEFSEPGFVRNAGLDHRAGLGLCSQTAGGLAAHGKRDLAQFTLRGHGCDGGVYCGLVGTGLCGCGVPGPVPYLSRTGPIAGRTFRDAVKVKPMSYAQRRARTQRPQNQPGQR